jgi:hypothetical protein
MWAIGEIERYLLPFWDLLEWTAFFRCITDLIIHHGLFGQGSRASESQIVRTSFSDSGSISENEIMKIQCRAFISLKLDLQFKSQSLGFGYQFLNHCQLSLLGEEDVSILMDHFMIQPESVWEFRVQKHICLIFFKKNCFGICL